MPASSLGAFACKAFHAQFVCLLFLFRRIVKNLFQFLDFLSRKKEETKLIVTFGPRKIYLQVLP